MDAAASASGDAGDTSARQARTDSRAAQADVATAVDNVDVTLGGAGSDSDTKASDADAAPVSRPREESVADMARRSRLQTGDCTPTAQPDAESLVSTQIAAGADAKRRPALTDRASVLTGIILVFVSVASACHCCCVNRARRPPQYLCCAPKCLPVCTDARVSGSC